MNNTGFLTKALLFVIAVALCGLLLKPFLMEVGLDGYAAEVPTVTGKSYRELTRELDELRRRMEEAAAKEGVDPKTWLLKKGWSVEDIERLGFIDEEKKKEIEARAKENKEEAMKRHKQIILELEERYGLKGTDLIIRLLWDIRGDVSTIESDVSTIESDVSTIESDVSTIDDTLRYLLIGR